MPVKTFLLLILVALFSCNKEENKGDQNDEVVVDSLFINNTYIGNNGTLHNIDIHQVTIRIKFRSAVDTNLFVRRKLFITGGIDTNYQYKFENNKQDLVLSLPTPLEGISTYRILFDQGANLGGFIYDSYSVVFHTGVDSAYKFPVISDDSLLTLVQKRTFDYFWLYGHPVSGLSRDRLGGGDVVTSGGSGFGMMAIITGIERGFITREEGFGRLKIMVDFLNKPSVSRFHGAYPHWLNGTSGSVIPFGQIDNGGDLVETAFLMQGLLTTRQYFLDGSVAETALCDTIQKIWEGVEWDWYRKNNENKLYWHWSPTFEWQLNMTVSGWNEALIVYVLAASSPLHSIPKAVYEQGWARNGAYPMVNGNTYYNIQLPLGESYGGPLFFAHYSFLGLDPQNLQDQFADYWTQNTAHALINYEYCMANPRNYPGYSSDCWGLTASDIPQGYSASSPSNDLGVIAPTAAISSMPYTPDESMKALRFFYYVLGDQLWGPYGFYDAFSIKDQWFADSYLAIDQGPIVCMIENYRTGLLWDLFMANTEIRSGLTKLGFSY
jgi:hypothetical protein